MGNLLSPVAAGAPGAGLLPPPAGAQAAASKRNRAALITERSTFMICLLF
jgi:hypothetical protein